MLFVLILFCFDCIGLSWFNAVSFQIFGIVWELWNPVTDFHEKLCLFIRNCFAVKEIFKNSFFLFSFFVFCALFGCLEIVGKDLLDLTCLEKRTKMSLN